ncbi:MAG: glycosyltransferase family 4 protein [Rubrobacter sp.]
MRILQVIEATGAGVGRHVRTLSEGLALLGHEVHVVYAPLRLDEAFRGFIQKGEGMGIRFSEMDVGREISPAGDLNAVRRVVEVARRYGPFDIVHGHSSKGGAIGRAAARIARVPAVYTPHSMILSSPDISRKKIALYTTAERVLGYGATSCLIAVSEDEGDFIRDLNVVPRARIRVIPNALRDEDFSYFNPEGHCGEGQRPLIFGATMRFSAQKAPLNLVEAFAQARKASPDTPMRLKIAGDGELLEECRKRVGELGLKGEVHLPGWVAGPGEFLGGLDVFVVSSHYEAGISYSTMEAMAAGLPVVSTKVFGASLVVGAGENLIVPTGDVRALSRAIEWMARVSGETLGSIGRANHEHARRNFDQEQATCRTLAIYRELAGTSDIAFP